MFNLALGHAQAAPAGPGGSSSARAGSLGVIAADAIIDNCMRMGELEPPLKTSTRKLLPDRVCGMNPWADSSRMRRRRKKTIESGVDSDDVGSIIVVLQAEILESYVESLKSIDYRGKPVIA